MIYPKTLRFIKLKYPKIKIISLSEDDMCKKHNLSLWYLFGLKFYDVVFTTKRHNFECLTRFGAKKVFRFYDSFDDTLHKIYKDRLKEVQVPSKSYWCVRKDRSEYLFFLAKSGIKVNVWGNDWDKCYFNHDNLYIHKSFLWRKISQNNL